MTTSSSLCFADVSDQDLLLDLRRLVSKSRQLEVGLLAHLAEVDARKLYLQEACSSMFIYCTQVLHFSEGTAYHRIAAARAARCYPALLERLESGEIHLSGITLLAPHLTRENHVDLLDQAKHKTKREIEQLVADLRPRPQAPSLVRRLPMPRPSGPAQVPSPPPAITRPPEPSRASPPRPEPLGGERFKIQFTATRETYNKLRELQALLRHQIPDGDLSQVFDRALELLLTDVKRKKFAETRTPRATRAVKDHPSRHVPAQIKRQVVSRDGGRCQYVSKSGQGCEARGFLEFHHTDPWARSRRHLADEIVLMCRAHNQYEGERVYGKRHMERHRSAHRPTTPGGS